MSFRPITILRLRLRTPDISIVKSLRAIPNSLLRRKYVATFALWMMFLLGKQAMFGHDPPMYLRSTTATRFPSPANVHAAIVEPVPPPSITRSNSSGCVVLAVAEELSMGFMRPFLSGHSEPALISQAPPLMLLRVTIRSQPLARCAPSTDE